MNKTYTVQKTQLREVAKNKAIIDYFLIDDTGKQRTVHALAKLGFGKKVKSIRAKYYRETPLVNALSKAENQQRIEVSYIKFNKKPRISLLPSDRELASVEMHQDSHNEMMFKEQNQAGLPVFSREGILFALLLVLWVFYMAQLFFK